MHVKLYNRRYVTGKILTDQSRTSLNRTQSNRLW